MSHYIKVNAQFKNAVSLVTALVAVGFDRAQVEVHAEGKPLNNYSGNKTQNIGHVVIDRKNVGEMCNDIGFNTQSGDVFICDYATNRAKNNRIRDAFKGHGDKFISRLQQEYQYAETADAYAAQGQQVERVDAPDGTIRAYVQC